MSPTHATKNRHKRYRYYVCVQAQQRGWQNCPAKSISAEPLERFVVEQLRALGAGANSLDSLRREDERRLAEFLRECEAARGELHNCDHEISRVRKQLDVNRVCDGKKVTTSERRLETARQEAATARNRLIALEAAHLRQQEAAECWRLFDPDWQELGAAVQGSILRRLMEHVEYDGPANSLAIRLKPGPVAKLAQEAAVRGIIEMSPEFTILYPIKFQPQAPWRSKLRLRKNEASAPAGRLPRISRLMALAIRFDRLRRAGEVADYATLAKLGHVSRARITQVMNLLHLAPDIQEDILFLPRVEHGKDPIHLRKLQPTAALMTWRQQRSRWRSLRAGLDHRAGVSIPTPK